MVIEKNGKFYTATECRKSWTVRIESGILSISYNIQKEICPTYDELKRYVMDSDIF